MGAEAVRPIRGVAWGTYRWEGLVISRHRHVGGFTPVLANNTTYPYKFLGQ
jgi:hypothetical protein